MFVSLLVVGLYLLPKVLNPGFVNDAFLVGPVSAVLACVTFLAATISYIIVPKKHIAIASFIVYTLLLATTANLVISTGETASPFVALWIAVSLFAGVFGSIGLGVLFSLGVLYMGYSVFTHATGATLLVAGLALFAPLIASFIIWHTKSTKENDRDKAFQELASELSHESNKADVVINSIDDGVVSIDKSGVIQLINPAAQRIIGWSSGDAVGLSYKSVIKLNDNKDVPITDSNDPVRKVLATGQEINSEDYSVMTEAGKKVFLSVVVSPIGRPHSGAIVVFRDITAKRAAEREQAEFISTASHEMRTPVASIEGYLGLALNPNTASIDARAQEYIQKAHESAQHLGRLFQDLLDVSKADDNRIGNDPSVVDVVEFVGNVAEGLLPEAKEKGLTFLYKPRPEGQYETNRTVAPVFYANVDNDHLREVISNLIENAIKYTVKGDVVVDVSADDQMVTISIADSGIGIPAEDIPHLFQKFYRVDNTDTREIGGTGLGLYLCRRLAEVMDGRIRVTSEYKKGSTFYLDIPRIDHDEATRLIEEATIHAEQAAETQIATVHTIHSALPLEAQAPPSPQQSPVSQPIYTQQTGVPIQPVTPQQAPPISPVQPPTRAPLKIPVRGDTTNKA